MLVEIIIFVLCILLYAYYSVTRKWTKFQSRGLAFAKPNFPFGSIHNWKLLFDSNAAISEIYKVYVDSDLSKEKIFGIYGHFCSSDALMVTDVDIAKRMLIKDFDHFVDRTPFGMTLNEDDEYDQLLLNMFALERGDVWKTHRSMVSPIFTTGKLKLMYPLLIKVSEQMENYVSINANQEIDSKDLFFKFALDGIATAGFGIDINTFKDPKNIFCRMVKEIQRAPDSEAGSGWELFKFSLAMFFPIIGKVLKVPNVSPKGAGFLRNSLRKTIELRRESKVKGGPKRNDVLDLIIEVMENKKENPTDAKYEDEFDKNAAIDMTDVNNLDMDLEKTLISNAFLLFAAGTDTTSSTLCFAVHYLLKYPHLQERIRDEVNEIVGDKDEISFEDIQNMKYLEKFLYETLRNSHAFTTIIERICTKDYKVPGTNYTIKKDEVVNFSIIYEKMKRESSSFYNGSEFDPENFDVFNNPDSFSFFGFGQGPRNCIGKRFAVMIMKLALVHILRKHQLVKSKNTKDDLRMYRFQAGADVPFIAIPI